MIELIKFILEWGGQHPFLFGFMLLLAFPLMMMVVIIVAEILSPS